MNRFKTITYYKMLFETLRNYMSVNREGRLSILYRFLLSCLWPLQGSFNELDIFRKKEKLIASCKWQIGQLTNVLNYFLDPDLQRIFIGQRVISNLYVKSIPYDSDVFVPVISGESDVYVSSIAWGATTLSAVIINIPDDVYYDNAKLSELISIINQVKISGIYYEIQLI